MFRLAIQDVIIGARGWRASLPTLRLLIRTDLNIVVADDSQDVEEQNLTLTLLIMPEILGMLVEEIDDLEGKKHVAVSLY